MKSVDFVAVNKKLNKKQKRTASRLAKAEEGVVILAGPPQKKIKSERDLLAEIMVKEMAKGGYVLVRPALR